jgi:hypothetical protein
MIDIPELADDAPRAEVAAWFEYLMQQVEAMLVKKEKAAKRKQQPHARG